MAVWILVRSILPDEAFLANTSPSNDTEKKQLKLTTQETSQLQSETLEMICFSNDGLWTFAVTPFPGNLHRIRVWCVSDITTSTYYDFQVTYPFDLRSNADPYLA